MFFRLLLVKESHKFLKLFVFFKTFSVFSFILWAFYLRIWASYFIAYATLEAPSILSLMPSAIFQAFSLIFLTNYYWVMSLYYWYSFYLLRRSSSSALLTWSLVIFMCWACFRIMLSMSYYDLYLFWDDERALNISSYYFCCYLLNPKDYSV